MAENDSRKFTKKLYLKVKCICEERMICIGKKGCGECNLKVIDILKTTVGKILVWDSDCLSTFSFRQGFLSEEILPIVLLTDIEGNLLYDSI